MKVKLNKPAVVKCLPCEVEVDEMEFARLQILDLVDVTEKETREIPEEKVKRTTRKK